MKSITSKSIIIFATVFFTYGCDIPLSNVATDIPSSQELSEIYPGDLGIEDDQDVVFTEMAESTTLTEFFTNWTVTSSAASLDLDSTTKPALSPGNKSIQLFTTSGSIGTVKLYKLFPGGYEGTLYARWYVKYNTYGTFHHSGTRLGGNNPESSVPNSHAGQLANGSDFFYIGAETSQAKKVPAAQSTYDFYNYWMHQRGNSIYPGLYYGNSFINNPLVTIDMNSWNCIEVQLTLNDPVSSYNGEISMWINDLQVSNVKNGTLGSWSEDHFTPDSNGSAFEGFQWRNDQNLKINFFQIEHFVDNDATGVVNRVNYDHIVIAKKRIGCLK